MHTRGAQRVNRFAQSAQIDQTEQSANSPKICYGGLQILIFTIFSCIYFLCFIEMSTSLENA